MKKITLILIIVSVIMACTNKQKADEAERKTKDSLLGIISDQDEVIYSYLSSFNDIEKTLDTIAQKQAKISLKTVRPLESSMGVIDDINVNINSINRLILKNQSKINELNRKLQSSSNNNKQLAEAIITLNEQLSQKESELVILKLKLSEANQKISPLETTVGHLTVENFTLEHTVAEEKAALHTAYYIVGTAKELRENNIIDKKGGLLGIGRTTQLKNDFDSHKFTRIDYTNISDIQIEGKNVKLITNHPSTAYILEHGSKTIKKIVITNPEEFWKASKYLVIVKE